MTFLSNAFISYTSREPEAKETWRAQDDSFKRALQNSELAGWDFGGGKLVQTVEHVVKVSYAETRPLKALIHGPSMVYTIAPNSRHGMKTGSS